MGGLLAAQKQSLISAEHREGLSYGQTLTVILRHKRCQPLQLLYEITKLLSSFELSRHCHTSTGRASMPTKASVEI